MFCAQCALLVCVCSMHCTVHRSLPRQVQGEGQLYCSKLHEKHTLKCGTKIIQTRKHRDQV